MRSTTFCAAAFLLLSSFWLPSELRAQTIAAANEVAALPQPKPNAVMPSGDQSQGESPTRPACAIFAIRDWPGAFLRWASIFRGPST